MLHISDNILQRGRKNVDNMLLKLHVLLTAPKSKNIYIPGGGGGGVVCGHFMY